MRLRMLDTRMKREKFLRDSTRAILHDEYPTPHPTATTSQPPPLTVLRAAIPSPQSRKPPNKSRVESNKLVPAQRTTSSRRAPDA
jgi:hypothetical protein